MKVNQHIWYGTYVTRNLWDASDSDIVTQLWNWLTKRKTNVAGICRDAWWVAVFFASGWQCFSEHARQWRHSFIHYAARFMRSWTTRSVRTATELQAQLACRARVRIFIFSIEISNFVQVSRARRKRFGWCSKSNLSWGDAINPRKLQSYSSFRTQKIFFIMC